MHDQNKKYATYISLSLLDMGIQRGVNNRPNFNSYYGLCETSNETCWILAHVVNTVKQFRMGHIQRCKGLLYQNKFVKKPHGLLLIIITK